MPPELELFLDENHHNNKQLLTALDDLSVPVHRYGAHFQPQQADILWMKFVSQHGWAVLTTDKRIRCRPLEKAAVRSNSVAMLCFTSNMGSEKMVHAVRRGIKKMRSIYAHTKPPYIATISEGGDVVVRESFTPDN